MSKWSNYEKHEKQTLGVIPVKVGDFEFYLKYSMKFQRKLESIYKETNDDLYEKKMIKLFSDMIIEGEKAKGFEAPSLEVIKTFVELHYMDIQKRLNEELLG